MNKFQFDQLIDVRDPIVQKAVSDIAKTHRAALEAHGVEFPLNFNHSAQVTNLFENLVDLYAAGE